MSDFGVTTEGFVEKTLEDILAEVVQAQRSAFGPDTNTQADSLLGQLNGIMGDQLAEIWEVSLSVYRARQPDSANGEPLDNVCAITGAIRLEERPSTVTAQINLATGATIPVGSVASIGPTGARWVSLVAVTNPAGFADTLAVDFESEDDAPIVGNAFSIDTIAIPVGGWSAKAAKNTLNSEPFALVDLQTLLVEIDEGLVQTVTFNTADFADISNASALEVAAAITADLADASAIDAGGEVRLISDTEGTGSAVEITGGTASESLAFTREKFRGFNPDVSAKIQNTTSESFALADGETLFVKVDQGVTQTITFTDALFAVVATGSLTAIAASLLAVGADTDTFILDDGVNPAVTFVFDDDSSVVETATLRAVNHTGVETADAMKTIIIAAITAAPTLDITATDGGTALAALANDLFGTLGNIAIVETVADGGFSFTGMAGGVDTTIATATAIEVSKAINTQITGAAAYEVLGKVQMESLVAGSNSNIEVTGGTANVELAFPEGVEQAGVTGDAVVGRDVESDPDFRLRREELLRLPGAGTVEAIRSAVRAVENVTQAFVFENPTDVVDSFGRPPHSFEVVVVGGDDQAIGDRIFLVKGAGIQTFKVPGPNGVTVSVTDTQGVTHDINYSRADPVQYHIEIDITADAATFGGGVQATGEQQVREALKALGDQQQIGEDIIIIQFSCAALDVTGVVDVPVTRIEDVDPPTNTANIVIAARDLATFSTADIDVNTTFI